MNRVSKLFFVLSMALILIMPRTALAAKSIEEKPSALAMTGDLVVARPFLLAMTVLGTATYLVSLPFSLLGGNAGEAGKTLVVGPAKATFVRCLGCTRVGRKERVVVSEEK